MLDNFNLILDLFRKLQEGESLSVIESFAVAGAIGAILGSLVTLLTISYYVYRTTKWSVSLISFSSLSQLCQNAITRLQSEETELQGNQPFNNYLLSGPLVVGIDVRNLLSRLCTGDCSTIKLDNEDVQHITKRERKSILRVAKQVRKQLIIKGIEDARTAAANKLCPKAIAKPEEDVKLDEKFIETEEILEMLRKRYGVNLSENNSKEKESRPF